MSRFGGYEDYRFVAEFYDLAYERNIRNNKDIEFFTGYSLEVNGPTLELGCGTGRILIHTAKSGCHITGLDLSPHMLKVCQEKLDRQPKEVRERVRLIQGNMTSFETGDKYHLLTIPFRPFQHLISIEEQRACLQCAHQHLVPKGLIVFDVFHPFPPRLVPNSEYTTEIEDVPETELPDGRKFRRTARITAFHRHQQYNNIEIIYYVTHPNGRTERLVQSFPMRYFYRYEIEHLLDLCDFRMINLYGDFDKSEFTDNSPEMIFIAQRK